MTDDSSEILGHLLEAWRVTLDPEIEQQIVELGADLNRGRPSIAALSRTPRFASSDTALEDAWHHVARDGDAGDIDRLMRAPLPQDQAHAVARLEELYQRPADPRVSLGLVRYATTYAEWGLHMRLGAMFRRARFESLEAALQEVMPHLRGRYTLGWYKEFEPPPEPPPEKPAPDAEFAMLYRMLAANPGDRGVRTVLADALQLREDPRGELIALQTAIAEGTSDETAPGRVRALLDQHASAWSDLPELDSASRRFERGFLVAARCLARGAALTSSFERPDWATLEELAVDGSTCDLGPLLARMPLLRVLMTHAFDPVRTPIAFAGPFPSLRVLGLCNAVTLANPDAFPNLRVLGVKWPPDEGAWSLDRYRDVQQRAVQRGLVATVHFGVSMSDAISTLPDRGEGPPETRYALARPHADFQQPGWRLAIPREGDHARAAWVAGGPYHGVALRRMIAALAGLGVRRLQLHLDRSAQAWVRRDLALARPAIDVSLDGAPIDLTAH